MLSQWPEQRRPQRWGNTPRPPSLLRLALFLAVVLGAIFWLLRLTQAAR